MINTCDSLRFMYSTCIWINPQINGKKKKDQSSQSDSTATGDQRTSDSSGSILDRLPTRIIGGLLDTTLESVREPGAPGQATVTTISTQLSSFSLSVCVSESLRQQMWKSFQHNLTVMIFREAQEECFAYMDGHCYP